MNLLRHSGGLRKRIVIVGTGAGGLAAALELAASGFEVIAIERDSEPGGKLKPASVGGVAFDVGPTVFTMRWVFEELFAAVGEDLAAHIPMQPVEILARHAWPGGARLDLFADPARTAEAIGDFAGAAEARAFERFRAEARAIYRLVEQPFIRAVHPSSLALIRRHGLEGLRIKPFTTLWRELDRRFRDTRLRQMFGRYATYCGSTPFAAPATLMLIAHVEQQGVWLVDGGMRRIAQALAALASARGATFRFGAHVDRLLVEGGRVAGVVLASGEVVPAAAVIVNGDVAAVASGLFGPKPARVVPRRPVAKRSFSAITFSMLAESDGFPLIRHNFFFSRDYRAEFANIVAGRLPREPTVYLCAQDRNDDGLTGAGRPDQDHRTPGGQALPRERLFHQLNVVARGDEQTLTPAEIEDYAKRTFSLLGSCGLMVKWHTEEMVVSTPADFHRRFPATGGALYGQATHGWRAPFQRPSVRTTLPGLYLAGGSTHPGAGVPMATLSGRMAAACLIADITSA
ncbi:1-hydroxycarotenoid 3,4-desaturase CrtD [Blastochloris viridis]|uniref:Diapolycopene oxygenase n=1 Tax=Blastochloris viridis TaxID=1079 RepID=A0A0H5BFF2_BLAVI|nr:1-hydroxycarotenoid 3,4-desaturase CrtD [Blastochloris viridis]ALK10932.1 Hydroxyneurosporene desaturase [Blastochloris viridis]BAR99086.1 methoxyneurosporene dehydrogenase [Blastochloris viridis]CUU43594.1 Diapolycopene oxygenase [Blastochloris viridis]